jgi:hypothetical protein
MYICTIINHKQIKINQMTTSNQIKAASPSGKMTMVSGTNNIVFDNGVVFSSETPREKTNLWNKLKRMGFEQHYNFSSDEFDGICQAAKNGENPFAYSIICSNPKLNGIFR